MNSKRVFYEASYLAPFGQDDACMRRACNQMLAAAIARLAKLRTNPIFGGVVQLGLR